MSQSPVKPTPCRPLRLGLPIAPASAKTERSSKMPLLFPPSNSIRPHQPTHRDSSASLPPVMERERERERYRSPTGQRCTFHAPSLPSNQRMIGHPFSRVDEPERPVWPLLLILCGKSTPVAVSASLATRALPWPFPTRLTSKRERWSPSDEQIARLYNIR